MTTDGGDDTVGYGRPPKKTRFKKGASGNPKGRPKRSRNVATEIAAELDTMISVRENGRELKMTKATALAKSLVSRALNGDIRAFALLRTIHPERFGLITDPIEISALQQEEAEILERLIARRLAQSAGPTPPDTSSQNEPSSSEHYDDD